MKTYFESELPKEITINDMPSAITIPQGIAKNQCFNNSYQLAKSNSQIEIVEGVIIQYTIRNTASIHSHVWNIIDGRHFDVTNEIIWKSAPESVEVREIKYFPIVKYPSSEYVNGDTWEFDSEVVESTDALRYILNNNDNDNP